MLNHTTEPVLLHKLFELLEAHRGVFRQERVYWRNMGLVLGGNCSILGDIPSRRD